MPRPNIFHQRFFNSAFTTFFMRGLVSPQPTLLQQTDYFCMRGLSQVSSQPTFFILIYSLLISYAWAVPG